MYQNSFGLLKLFHPLLNAKKFHFAFRTHLSQWYIVWWTVVSNVFCVSPPQSCNYFLNSIYVWVHTILSDIVCPKNIIEDVYIWPLEFASNLVSNAVDFVVIIISFFLFESRPYSPILTCWLWHIATLWCLNLVNHLLTKSPICSAALFPSVPWSIALCPKWKTRLSCLVPAEKDSILLLTSLMVVEGYECIVVSLPISPCVIKFIRAVWYDKMFSKSWYKLRKKLSAVGINLFSFFVFVAINNFCQHFLNLSPWKKTISNIAWSYRDLLLSRAVWSSLFACLFFSKSFFSPVISTFCKLLVSSDDLLFSLCFRICWMSLSLFHFARTAASILSLDTLGLVIIHQWLIPKKTVRRKKTTQNFDLKKTWKWNNC